MDYKQWVDLFGRTTEDEALQAALAAVGVDKPPVIPKDELRARVELNGIMLIFTDEALFPDLEEVGEGGGVLTRVVLFLKDGSYTGSLPFDLNRDDTQEALRARFGDPIKEDEEFRWDEWKVDELLLRVKYTGDWAALQQVIVKLPSPS